MMNQRPLIINVLMVIGLLLGAGFVLSIVLGLVSGLLWLAIKIFIPVAIIVWIVKAISNPRNNNHRHY